MSCAGRRHRIAIVGGFVIILTGCATTPQLKTASGKPEVTIPNTTKKVIFDALTNAMIQQGYEIRNINDYSAVYGKRTNSILASMLLGSQYDSTPEARVAYTIVDTSEGVRVVATLQMITNPGSAFERVTDFSQQPDAQSWQSFLENLRDLLNHQ